MNSKRAYARASKYGVHFDPKNIQENQEVWSKTENETEKANENNHKRENKTNGGTSRQDQRVKGGISHGTYANQYENDNQQTRSKEKCSFDHLPNKIIAMIFETALRSCSNSSYPSDACILFQRLRNVFSRFRQCVDTLVVIDLGVPAIDSLRSSLCAHMASLPQVYNYCVQRCVQK